MQLERAALQTDVLVVGSGAAGLMAALTAADAGADVTLVTKGGLRLSATQMANGGFAAAFGHSDPRDTPKAHLADSLDASDGLADPNLARAMVEQIPEVARQLDAWGADFIKLEDGRFHQKANQNHTYPRIVHRYDDSGPVIIGTLVNQVRAGRVRILEHTMIVDAVLAGGRAVGCWGLDVRGGRLLAIRARAVVLATGGGSQIYYMNDNPPVVTGDGYGIALRAGARLADMEMVEYQLGVVSPAKLRGYNPHPNGLLARGARLYNGHGERFMYRYDAEHLEATPDRALICRATALEVFEGRGTSAGGVYLDLSDGNAELERLKIIQPLRQQFSGAGVDLSYQPIGIAPVAHTFLGGVVIDEWCRTGVPGLLAAGETTGRVHGARRLGGNALSDALVFGVAAGRASLEEPAVPPNVTADDVVREAEAGLARILGRLSGLDVDGVRLELQRAMDRDAMVVREEMGLQRVLTKIRELCWAGTQQAVSQETPKRGELLLFRRGLELRNLLVTAEAVVLAALERRESRGFHHRIDYPHRDDVNWRRNVYVLLRTDELVVAPGPIVG